MGVQGPVSIPFRPYVPANLPAARPPAPEPAPSGEPPAAPAESSLWEMLTGEERDFFSQQASLGALTYGRARGATASMPGAGAPLGQRIDVRG